MLLDLWAFLDRQRVQENAVSRTVASPKRSKSIECPGEMLAQKLMFPVEFLKSLLVLFYDRKDNCLRTSFY